MIEAAWNTKFRMAADVAFEYLAIISDTSQHTYCPVVRQAGLFAERSFGADQPPDFRLGRFQRFRHVLRRNAKLLGVDESENRPLDDIAPLFIALTHSRAQRLL